MPNHASTSLCHPVETRALTLRECARVQEFPDDWEFMGSPSEQFAQVGNAVPVRLGVVAGSLIAHHLDVAESEGLARRAGEFESIRQVYLQSHVRTRRWYKAGRTYAWVDGEERGGGATYGAAKTRRKESTRARRNSPLPPRGA
jgi:DNA (cytosine-5)-methyltransferase 1